MRIRAANRSRPRIVRSLLAVLAFGLVVGPGRGSAQALTTTLGVVGGTAAGAYVTTGIYVLKSRTTGWVMHSPADLIEISPEVLPLVAGPVVGALLGYQSPEKLSAAAAWGGVGFASGAAVGVGVGHLIWGDSEGRWAGGTIGSAIGLAIGAIAGAVNRREDAGSDSEPAAYLSFSLPLGGIR